MTVTGSTRSALHPDRRALTLTVLAVAAAAWLGLGLGGEAFAHHSAAAHAGHAGHGGNGGPGITAVATGWLLMVLAMMLPPALPMLDLLRTLAARTARPTVVVGAGATAFVAVWAVAGAVLIGADTVLRAVVASWGPLAGAPQVPAGVVLVLAGLYQLTPLAANCLRACRTPRGFAVAHWHGERPAWVESGAVAGAYGLSCVGCCWAPMSVCLVVGVAALPVMVLLAAVMAAQRLARRGRSLVRPTGVALIAAGVAVATGLLPV